MFHGVIQKITLAQFFRHSVYLLNFFVNIVITFLFNIYLRVPYGMCLSVVQRKHHKACDLLRLTGVGLVVAEFCC